MDKIEIRCLCDSQLRSDSHAHQLRGYAAVFNQLSEPLTGFREKIRPGAFKRSVQSGADVRALVDHNPAMIIGRTRAGTLRLLEDAHGLLTEIDLPPTTIGHDLYQSVRRGDVSAMSFGFRVIKDAWPEKNIRELLDVELFDVSVVSFPAYPQTSVDVRNGQQISVGWYGRKTPWERLRRKVRLIELNGAALGALSPTAERKMRYRRHRVWFVETLARVYGPISSHGNRR